MIPAYGRRHNLPVDPASVHRFRFHRATLRPLALLGVRPANSYVFLDTDVLDVKFGPWRITTPTTNILAAEPTGRLSLWRSLGVRVREPGHALAFACHRTGGLRILFRRPVHRLDRHSQTGHLTLTVTVHDTQRLITRLRQTATAAGEAVAHREGPHG